MQYQFSYSNTIFVVVLVGNQYNAIVSYELIKSIIMTLFSYLTYYLYAIWSMKNIIKKYLFPMD